MHDPLTVAFEIKYPWRKYGRRGKTDWERNYRESFITIWHKDPERDGSDDSCGWFKRARHGERDVLEKIRKDFDYQWDAQYDGWFDAEGNPLYSSHAIAMFMFWRAAIVHFGTHSKAKRFMKRNLCDILFFAENPVDSLHTSIVQKYGKERKDTRVEHFSAIVYGWILRADQRWWQHPRWHVHHWRLQIHPWQQLRRRVWDKCCVCKKRGFPKGVGAIGDWSGTRIWHDTCDRSASAASPAERDGGGV